MQKGKKSCKKHNLRLKDSIARKSKPVWNQKNVQNSDSQKLKVKPQWLRFF